MSTADDLEKVLSKIAQTTIPDSANLTPAVIQLALTEEGGGNWLLKINNNKIDVEQGQVPEPDLTLGMSAADFVRLLKRELSPMELFMNGQITMQGDMSLALQFQGLFDDDDET